MRQCLQGVPCLHCRVVASRVGTCEGHSSGSCGFSLWSPGKGICESGSSVLWGIWGTSWPSTLNCQGSDRVTQPTQQPLLPEKAAGAGAAGGWPKPACPPLAPPRPVCNSSWVAQRLIVPAQSRWPGSCEESGWEVSSRPVQQSCRPPVGKAAFVTSCL